MDEDVEVEADVSDMDVVADNVDDDDVDDDDDDDDGVDAVFQNFPCTNIRATLTPSFLLTVSLWM